VCGCLHSVFLLESVGLLTASCCSLLSCLIVSQGWDHLIGHTPEAVAKSGKALVGATLLISLVAASVELD
jgi:hypothetical protein